MGSRGTSLADKRVLLESVLVTVQPESTLDVGSGDGEATRGLASSHYARIDRSARKAFLISGDEEPRLHDPPMIDAHEPLSTTPDPCAPRRALRVEYEITTWLVETPVND